MLYKLLEELQPPRRATTSNFLVPWSVVMEAPHLATVIVEDAKHREELNGYTDV